MRPAWLVVMKVRSRDRPNGNRTRNRCADCLLSVTFFMLAHCPNAFRRCT